MEMSISKLQLLLPKIKEKKIRLYNLENRKKEIHKNMTVQSSIT